MSCVFCSIISGEIPARIVYQDDSVIAFHDLHPAAPLHVLIVPCRHTDNVLDLAAAPHGAEDWLAILAAVPAIASVLGLSEDGFRLINNCGRDGGQTVNHLHLHLLGGRPLGPGLV